MIKKIFLGLFLLMFSSTLVLLILKLNNVINWDWGLVFSPLWAPIVVIIVGVFLVFGITLLLPDKIKRRKE